MLGSAGRSVCTHVAKRGPITVFKKREYPWWERKVSIFEDFLGKIGLPPIYNKTTRSRMKYDRSGGREAGYFDYISS